MRDAGLNRGIRGVKGGDVEGVEVFVSDGVEVRLGRAGETVPVGLSLYFPSICREQSVR